MNKAISTPIAIIIVLIVFTISIGLILLGYIYWPKEEVVLEQIEDEFADWNIYRNKEYGFEFKYPRGFEIEEEWTYDFSGQEIPEDFYLKQKFLNGEPVRVLNYVIISYPSFPPEGMSFKITVFNNANNLTVNEWLNYIDEKNVYEGLLVGNRKSESVNGVEGITGTYGCCMSCIKGIFIPKEGKIYNISILGLGGSFPDYVGYYEYSEEGGCYLGDEDTFKKILSTFKFIN